YRKRCTNPCSMPTGAPCTFEGHAEPRGRIVHNETVRYFARRPAFAKASAGESTSPPKLRSSQGGRRAIDSSLPHCLIVNLAFSASLRLCVNPPSYTASVSL